MQLEVNRNEVMKDFGIARPTLAFGQVKVKICECTINALAPTVGPLVPNIRFSNNSFFEHRLLHAS